MELNIQIKKYRTDMKLSQEELAEKVYVTRQTISNWENGKSYPDIHSLLLLGSVFNVSLDQLIKGDIEIMKDEIKEDDIKKFNTDANIYTVLLMTSIVSAIPLVKFLGIYGMAVVVLLFGMSLFYAFRIEKYKKKNDIQTYKEIIAFTKGERLDEISKAREEGKRPYQKVLLAVGSGVVAIIVCFLWFLLL